MSLDPWRSLDAELARTAEAGRTTRFWLRDDDAVAVTPALERLGALCDAARMPVLLAVIPAGATRTLAEWTAGNRFVTPCQHGWSHANHAAPGERACELGGQRPDLAVLADLARGREVMGELFGQSAARILVPPWNRIRASLIPLLGDAGYRALSTFGRPAPDPAHGIAEINCDLDIIDWRNGRRGRTAEDLCARLIALLGASHRPGRRIGVLTHHLAHDEAAWRFLESFLARMADTPGVEFVGAVSMG